MKGRELLSEISKRRAGTYWRFYAEELLGKETESTLNDLLENELIGQGKFGNIPFLWLTEKGTLTLENA